MDAGEIFLSDGKNDFTRPFCRHTQTHGCCFWSNRATFMANARAATTYHSLALVGFVGLSARCNELLSSGGSGQRYR